MPLRSPLSLLQRDLVPIPDLNPDLYLIVDTPEGAATLDLFIPLLWGDLDLDPDLVLTSQEDHPIPLTSLSSPLFGISGGRRRQGQRRQGKLKRREYWG